MKGLTPQLLCLRVYLSPKQQQQQQQQTKAPKQEQPKAPIEVQVSFGGLLMRLIGDSHHLEKLHLDSRVYLLIRKINQGGADIDML